MTEDCREVDDFLGFAAEGDGDGEVVGAEAAEVTVGCFAGVDVVAGDADGGEGR